MKDENGDNGDNEDGDLAISSIISCAKTSGESERELIVPFLPLAICV